MPAYVEIRGTGDFRRTAAKLKAAGNGKLTREMAKRMKTAAQPAVNDAQREVRSLESAATRGGGGQARRAHALSKKRKLTDRVKAKAFAGRGLRSSVARAVQTQVRSSGASASVRIRVNTGQLPPNQRTLPGHMNTGRWRRPTFGHRPWVTQTTSPPGWFDRPMRRHGTKIRDDAASVVYQIARDITT